MKFDLQYQPAEKVLSSLQTSADFVELKPSNLISIDLRYASDNNFTGHNVYGAFNRIFLHRDAAQKFQVALKLLEQNHPGYRFIVFDALRPRAIQRVLWSKVVGTDQEKYIANPDRGSMHNYGLAIDLSLLDETGRELDMGTVFDAFTDLAEPQLEDKFWLAGKLSDLHIKNRKILRNIMEQAGFIQLPYEWWHFDALSREQVKANYQIVE